MGTSLFGSTLPSLPLFPDTLRAFGAAAGGLIDDSAAVALAALSGRKIDLEGLTYKCSQKITQFASQTVFDNGTLDFSGSPTLTGPLLYAGGTIGTYTSLTIDTLEHTAAARVVSTAQFVDGDIAFIISDGIHSSSQGVVFGQYVRILDVVSSTDLTFYSPVDFDFTTTQNARIAKVTPVERVVLGPNFKIVGAQTNLQQGFRIEYGKDCRVHAKFKSIDYVHCALWRCFNTVVTECDFDDALAAGEAYGVSIWGGCYKTNIYANTGRNLRHPVTIGDNDGINLFNEIHDNIFDECRSAGVDSHCAGRHTKIYNNQIILSNNTAAEGITVQSQDVEIYNNSIFNIQDTGVYHQCEVDYPGAVTTGSIWGNEITIALASTFTVIPIYVQIATGTNADIDGFKIKDNTVIGGAGTVDQHIYCHIIKPNGKIDNLEIQGNICKDDATNIALYLRATGAGASYNTLSISDNQLSCSNTHVITMQAEGVGSSFNNVTGSGNILGNTPSSTSTWNLTGAGTFNHFRMGKNLYPGVVKMLTAVNMTDYLWTDLDDIAVQVITTTSHTPAFTGNKFRYNKAGAQTVTLPPAVDNPGRVFEFNMVQAFTLTSNSADVIPPGSTVAGTAILPATGGTWGRLESDGANWVLVQRGA